jgi:hypothetical protein
MALSEVDSDYIKEVIDGVRDQIGRDISIYTPIRSACVRCTASGFYDSISDHSIFFTCPECKGTFWKSGMEETTINARVHWTTNEGITATPAGKYYSGDAYFHVTTEYHELLQKCQNGGKVMIDTQEMNIIKINPQGAPVVNRYKAILKGRGGPPEG